MAGKRKGSPNIYIEREMVYSQAFRDLTGAAKDVLLIFLAKRQMGKVGRSGDRRWVIQNNGQITFTYEEAAKYGITARRFLHARDQVVEKGFIDITCNGAGIKDGVKDPTKYAISDRWRDYGKARFKEKHREKDMRDIGYRGRKKPTT